MKKVEQVKGWTARHVLSTPFKNRLRDVIFEWPLFHCFQDNVVYEPQFGHRIVLAAASPYFSAMFTNDVVEAKRQQIFLQSINARDIYCHKNFQIFNLKFLLETFPMEVNEGAKSGTRCA